MNTVSAPGSVDCFQVLVGCRLITAPKCLSEIVQSWPQSVPLSLLIHNRQLHFITASKFAELWPLKGIPKLAQSWPSRSHDYGLQLHIQTRATIGWQCISLLTQWRPWSSHDCVLPSSSPNLLNYVLQMHIQSRSITASKCISQLTRWSSSGAPQTAPKHCLQPVQIYCV